MANYRWARDELLLALDLYFREPSARGNASHPDVEALSELLNSLAIHPAGDREDYFRNPNGVAMKLSNFLPFDPAYDGAGLARGGRLDEVVWNEFAGDRERLAKVADAIRRAAGEVQGVPEALSEDEEAEALEGRILTRLHRIRERSQALVRRKKARVLEETGRLACEACGFDFAEAYGERGEGFAECHHTTALSDLKPGSRTRVRDLAIVCANCHRMIHRRAPWLNVEELREHFAHVRDSVG